MSDDETKELNENKHLRSFFVSQEDVEKKISKLNIENTILRDKVSKVIASISSNSEQVNEVIMKLNLCKNRNTLEGFNFLPDEEMKERTEPFIRSLSRMIIPKKTK
ncbi:hypothetical protein PsAD5_02510 [Pseudovibrio sp. Ad5]|nr:hypothetical protein PsAD5_02510 [Pseudovibrio sp. Ad5]